MDSGGSGQVFQDTNIPASSRSKRRNIFGRFWHRYKKRGTATTGLRPFPPPTTTAPAVAVTVAANTRLSHVASSSSPQPALPPSSLSSRKYVLNRKAPAVVLGITLPPSMIAAPDTPHGIANTATTIADDDHNTTDLPHRASKKHNSKFWLSRSLEEPIVALKKIYVGHIIRSTGTEILIEESRFENINRNILVLPCYIGQHLSSVYTEKNCRDIFRQVCLIVQKLHHWHVVHRNIHLNHLGVTSKVRNL